MLTNTPRDFYIRILERVPKGETTGEYCGSCHLTLCVKSRNGERIASLVPPPPSIRTQQVGAAGLCC